jgi:hypothetical protein
LRSGCLVLVKGRGVWLVVVKAGVLSELLRAVGVVRGVRGSRSVEVRGGVRNRGVVRDA